MIIPIESSPPPGWDPGGTDLLLDAFPAGRLSEIVGPCSSGATSLLLALIARTTASGHHAALVDGADAFDPASAVAAGADLSRILWVKCGGHLRRSFSAADLLVRCPGFALVALDLGDAALIRREPIPPALCLRLKIAVEQSETALVLRSPRRLAGSAAQLAVSARRIESHWIGRRFAGLTSEILVLRSRAAHGRETPRVVRWQL